MDRGKSEDPCLRTSTDTVQGTTPTEHDHPTTPLDTPRKVHSSASSRSHHSSRTASSATSSVWMKQMAKREAAKVRLQFAEEEAAILRRQAEREAQHQKENADMKADLKLLESRRDLQEAEAELEVMNELLCTNEKYDLESGDDMKDIANQRTAEYVTGLQSTDCDDQPQNLLHPNSSHSTPRVGRNICIASKVNNANMKGRQLRPGAPPFSPTGNQEPRADPRTLDQTSGVSELMKYIMKKDLVLSRLMQFDDRPERYFLWKSSFKNITKELEVNPTEELDLLCRWLGPGSSIQASSLRAANCSNEAVAVRKIWERLETRYGAPELVVQSFQERFERFPRLTVKDSVKVYELSDLLTEMESLKEDRRYTSSLAYLDSSAGVNPIISKLPGFMQGKWTDSAIRYKRDHDVIYPPFTLFAEFIRNMAIRMNDPSFVFESSNVTKSFPSNPYVKKAAVQAPTNRFAVSARKTDVENKTSTEGACPIHGDTAKHDLRDCRTFQGKSIPDKKEIIMKYGICFRCCVGKHLAKDCTENIKCENCGSASHCTAFHRETRLSHGGESVKNSYSGKVTKSGKQATGYVIESLDGTSNIKCPMLIECNEIPNEREEIPTPAVARHYRHLHDIEQLIPEYDPNAQVLLLIGRDMISAHHVLDQRIGSGKEPYAQRLRLGWVIVGETCLRKVHMSDSVTVNKTHVLQDGRESILKPCPNGFELKDIHTDIFQRTAEDEEPGLSREDMEFSRIMEEGFTRGSGGNWSAPLPFRKGRPRLPINYQQARQRAANLAKGLMRDSTKQEHFVEFMRKIFDNKHAEEAPPIEEGEERWYLPIFGVYHPKKPSKIRVVFDSSAKYNGVSLNDVLLTGPDLTNNLVGVLLKFRKEKVAVTADVEQMFFNFEVHEEHRNLLRFLWFKDNDPTKEIIEHRMRVHVFGNAPSPAVATYGLRKSACTHEGESSVCDDVCDYVKENFYVDDALVSRKSEEDAVSLIKRTQKRLKEGGNIRLHNIASNSANVIASFPSSDLANNMAEMNFNPETPNVLRSLGLSWDVTKDVFTYQVAEDDKPYTKRWLLSTVHSIFDPLGFVAPVILGGRLLLKEAVQNSVICWDERLPDKVESNWEDWKTSLHDLENLEIPRTFTDASLEESVRHELHMFSDASKEAIGAVGYLKIYDANASSKLGFVFGKSKIAPNHGHTIPDLNYALRYSPPSCQTS